MQMITESCFDIKTTLNEETKQLFIEGVFATANQKNKNGRVYKKSL